MRFMVEGIAPILQIGTLRLREAQVTQLAGSAQMQRPMRRPPQPSRNSWGMTASDLIMIS